MTPGGPVKYPGLVMVIMDNKGVHNGVHLSCKVKLFVFAHTKTGKPSFPLKTAALDALKRFHQTRQLLFVIFVP